MRQLVVIGFLVLGIVSAAAEPPTIPKFEIDNVDSLALLKGQTPESFFAKRIEDKACIETGLSLRKSYYDAKKSLEALIQNKASADAIDDQGKVVDAAQDKVLKQLETCGECAVRPIEKRTVYTTGRPQHWYLADGSCYLPAAGLDAGQVRKVFEAAANRLMDASRYSKVDGGFPSILDFQSVDPASGEKIANGKILAEPYHAFFALLGPMVPLINIPTSFTYVANNTFLPKPGQALDKEFGIRFESIKSTGPAEVFDTLPSGRKVKTTNRHLSSVQGMWYLTSDGYIRYYTAADFGLNLSIADSFAMKTLMQALFTVVDQGISEGLGEAQ